MPTDRRTDELTPEERRLRWARTVALAMDFPPTGPDAGTVIGVVTVLGILYAILFP
jgi:hypothetical protein